MSNVTEQSPEIKEYFKFKGSISTDAFLEVMNSVPSIRVVPHEGQRKIIEAYEERIPASPEVARMGLDWEPKYRCIVAACGRRFGKSVISSVLGAAELMIPNSRVFIAAYTQENAGVIFDNIRKIIKGLGIEIVVDRTKDMELILINNASLKIGSSINIEAKLGKNISLLVVDEAKLFDQKLYRQILEPMLLDFYPFGRSILISSPENNWFEKFYNFGQSTDPKYEKYWSINLPSSSNPNLPKEYLEQLRSTIAPDIYAQEYLGLFTSAAGRVVQEFTEENIFNTFDEPHWDSWIRYGNTIVNTIDSGYSHFFASVHFMYVEETDTYYVFNEYQQNKKVTSVHAEAIKEFESELGRESDLRYADPAASQQIADLVLWDLYYNKAEKNLRETINCLNSLLFQRSEITGKPRLLISSTCYELLRQLKTIQWKEGEDNQTREKSAAGTKPFAPDKDKQTDWDLFDAFRYGLYTFHKNHGTSISILSYDNEDEELDPYTKMMMEQGYVKVGG